MAKPREAHGIPEVPANSTPAERAFMTAVRNTVVRIQGIRAPVEPITNLRVTPIGFGNNIDFTRSNGDSYILWWSLTPNSMDANPIQIGNISRYAHAVGKDGVKVYYWVQAVNDNGSKSRLIGPKFGTTLLSNAAVTLPDPPPSSSTPVIDGSTGRFDPDGGFTR